MGKGTILQISIHDKHKSSPVETKKLTTKSTRRPSVPKHKINIGIRKHPGITLMIAMVHISQGAIFKNRILAGESIIIRQVSYFVSVLIHLLQLFDIKIHITFPIKQIMTSIEGINTETRMDILVM